MIASLHALHDSKITALLVDLSPCAMALVGIFQTA